MGLSLYLESQKQAIATSVAFQNAVKKRNPNVSDSIDISGTCISIFGSAVRDAIRNQAKKCNDVSSQIILKNGKNNEAVKSASKVNTEIAQLQAINAWAGASSQEIANIPGISNSAISAINRSMSETLNFGAATISQAASQANDAISKITTTQNQPVESAVKTIQNNIKAVAQNTVTSMETAPVTKGETTAKDGMTPAAETKTAQPAVETKKAAPATAEQKAAIVKPETKIAQPAFEAKTDNQFLTATTKQNDNQN